MGKSSVSSTSFPGSFLYFEKVEKGPWERGWRFTGFSNICAPERPVTHNKLFHQPVLVFSLYIFSTERPGRGRVRSQNFCLQGAAAPAALLAQLPMLMDFFLAWAISFSPPPRKRVLCVIQGEKETSRERYAMLCQTSRTVYSYYHDRLNELYIIRRSIEVQCR